jgi:hypothetical protein
MGRTIADCRLPIADCRLPIADCRLLIADWLRLLASHYTEWLNDQIDNRKSAIGNRPAYPLTQVVQAYLFAASAIVLTSAVGDERP